MERATITFSDDNRRQRIVWEWRQTPDGEWLPLCERVAVRTDEQETKNGSRTEN
jgi:hypothetical protein